MRDFHKVSPAVWHDPRFRGLKKGAHRLAHLYVLFGPHQNSTGVSKLPAPYVATDLEISVASAKSALSVLQSAGLIVHDSQYDLVYATDWFRTNPPMNMKHLLGIHKQLDRFPTCELIERVREEADCANQERQAAADKFKLAKQLRADSEKRAYLAKTPYLSAVSKISNG